MQNQSVDTCGCCEGVTAITPASVENRPGLTALSYRTGTHGSFKQSMQNRLSKESALQALTTRDDDDPALALMDAWAVVLDVLGFYQERITDEGYLRTANERRSLLELARHISYRLRPGVAAGTYLVFTMESAPGAPTEVNIAKGTKTQSIPGQDENPQVFETLEKITAKAAWNALKPRLSRMKNPVSGDTVLYVKGTATNLNEGDALLLIGKERFDSIYSNQWSLLKVKSVQVVHPAVPTGKPGDGYTVVTIEGVLKEGGTPLKEVKLYALRRQAALFGWNAPDWKAMPDSLKISYLSLKEDKPDLSPYSQWPGFNMAAIANPPGGDNIVHLDAYYKEIQVNGWLVMKAGEEQEACKVREAEKDSRTAFTLTSKTTRLKLDGDDFWKLFNDKIRETAVYAQSDQLPLAETPEMDPVYGEEIILDSLISGMEKGRKLMVTGKCIRIVFRKDYKTSLDIYTGKSSAQKFFKKGEQLILIGEPQGLPGYTRKKTHKIKGNLGIDGKKMDVADSVILQGDLYDYTSARENDPFISEVVELDVLESVDDFHTKIKLKNKLKYIYDRSTVTISGNVVKAGHGETKTEVLGSGDGSSVFQEFRLKQKPMTYVPAATGDGTETTLEIRVNDVLWKEVSTFYRVSPDARVYITRLADDGTVTVQFGDGITGSRLPTGTENIVATYRVGTGSGGMVKAEQISMLMSPQLGLKSVVNPLAPSGADDPETRENARSNAPLTVLTMDRIVSLRDFEDFAAAFAGIGKAKATWLWNGEQRLVHITVAPAQGKTITGETDPFEKLKTAIDAARHSQIEVRIALYQPISFGMSAKVLMDDTYWPDKVKTEVIGALTKAFTFSKRQFAQPVTPSEVTAVIQAVKGILAVDLETLGGQDPLSMEHFLLPARPARWDNSLQEIAPAELLTINTDDITIETRTVSVGEINK